jgi:Tol biopolymer transport system component
MKIILSLAVYCLAALCLFRCSIDVSQPAIPTSDSEIGSASPLPPPLAISKVPITWANLNLSGRLVYISLDSLDNEVSPSIQILDLATGEVATIFRSPKGAWIFYVTLSTDAKQLVMSYIPPSQSTASSNRALYIMPLDTATPPQPLFLPPTPHDHYVQAEWLPDGKYIYYAHYNDNDQPLGGLSPAYDIFRMTYPEGQPEKIVDHAFWPRISSDSSKLVYVSVDQVSGKNELFLANANGSNPQRVAFSGPWIPEIIDTPIVSPDGKSILFSAPGPIQSYQPNWFERFMGIQVAKAHSIPSDWWSVPVTGGVPTRLTRLQTINLFASISPDKQHIASLSGDGIFVMDLDGSNLTRLILDPGVLGTVSWIP